MDIAKHARELLQGAILHLQDNNKTIHTLGPQITACGGFEGWVLLSPSCEVLAQANNPLDVLLFARRQQMSIHPLGDPT